MPRSEAWPGRVSSTSRGATAPPPPPRLQHKNTLPLASRRRHLQPPPREGPPTLTTSITNWNSNNLKSLLPEVASPGGATTVPLQHEHLRSDRNVHKSVSRPSSIAGEVETAVALLRNP
ncbi:hypothetical protein NL676_026034 [Syzygium grande]|nr:hypothetical protein NL676_026034 [Syzygium grande]